KKGRRNDRLSRPSASPDHHASKDSRHGHRSPASRTPTQGATQGDAERINRAGERRSPPSAGGRRGDRTCATSQPTSRSAPQSQTAKSDSKVRQQSQTRLGT